MPRSVNMYDEGRVQGRNFAASDNIQIISPGVITDGLVLHLDAGNYASYPASGTIWRDLSSQRNNGTLTNGPTFNANNGGFIVFDGINDTVDCGAVPEIGSLLKGLTVSAWIYPTRSATSIISDNGSSFNTGTFYLAQEDATNFSFSVYAAGRQDRVKSSSTYSLNVWYNLVGVWVSGSPVQIYTNGLETNGVRLSNTRTSLQNGNTNLFLGSRAGTVFYFKGNIPFFSAYNRALSPQEIAQNFNATRARFGI